MTDSKCVIAIESAQLLSVQASPLRGDLSPSPKVMARTGFCSRSGSSIKSHRAKEGYFSRPCCLLTVTKQESFSGMEALL